MSNAPDRWAQQTIQEGEKRVEVEDENRVPNAAVFKFNKEGHTLGNLLRTALVEHPHVIFAAYVIPHPMIPEMIVRVQTDGEITPKQAMSECCEKTIRDLETFKINFNREYEIAKAVKASQGIDITKPSSGRTFRTGAFDGAGRANGTGI